MGSGYPSGPADADQNIVIPYTRGDEHDDVEVFVFSSSRRKRCLDDDPLRHQLSRGCQLVEPSRPIAERFDVKLQRFGLGISG